MSGVRSQPLPPRADRLISNIGWGVVVTPLGGLGGTVGMIFLILYFGHTDGFFRDSIDVLGILVIGMLIGSAFASAATVVVMPNLRSDVESYPPHKHIKRQHLYF